MLQTKESFSKKLKSPNIIFNHNSTQLHLETDDFDEFTTRLESLDNINYLNKITKDNLQQRNVMIYDPDFHLVLVTEKLENVVLNYLHEGYSVNEPANKMDVSINYVTSILQSHNSYEDNN